MTKKKIAIIIWAIAGVIFLIVGLSVSHANSTTTGSGSGMIGGPKASATATDLPLPSETPTPTPTPTKAMVVKPAPKVVGPASFVLPNFVDMDENEVEAWFDAHNINVSTEFDYGDASGTDCEDAGDGIVEDQTPEAGTKLSNSLSTDVYLAVYCDY